MTQYFLPIRKLREKPYSNILCFPKPTKRQIDNRVNELKRLGITSVKFFGPVQIQGLDVLGKGYVGVVILGKKQNKIFALKIRRIDSQRNKLTDEAKLLKIANKIGVGPQLISSSKNFLVMEYITGTKIINWVKDEKFSSKTLRIIIKKILFDCFRLDQLGLDHGELSVLDKHVLVTNKKPTIIDFESSSVNRKTSNVSSAVQAILIGTGLSKIIRKKITLPKKNIIINSVRNYKKIKTEDSFNELLLKLKL